MQKTMLYWQNNWQLGLGLSILIVLTLYITVSVFVLVKARKHGHGVYLSAFVPVVNLLVGVKCFIKDKISAKKEKKNLLQEEKENEEIELW